MSDSVEQVLAKQRRLDQTTSIQALVGRGGTLRSLRGQNLVDRYNTLRSFLVRDSYATWAAYCERCGCDRRHDGYDLFMVQPRGNSPWFPGVF